MYNINILSECNDEVVRVAIIAAVNEILNSKSNLIVRKMKRGGVNSPIWNEFSRKEYLDNKF